MEEEEGTAKGISKQKQPTFRKDRPSRETWKDDRL